jgi:spore coat protein U-like protein
MTKTHAALAVALLGALGVSSAQAASSTSPKTATFQVSLTIENSCTITAQPIAFGTVSSMATTHAAQGDVVVSCTGAGPLNVQLGVGTGGGTLATRQLDNGSGNKIDYNLYNDGGHSVISGDGTTGTPLFAGTSTGAAQTLTVFAQTAAGQNPKPVGTYTSDVTATVTF